MPRLRNIKSGVVVSCSEETATRLGAEWQPADKPAAKTPAPAKKTAAKKSAADKSD